MISKNKIGFFSLSSSMIALWLVIAMIGFMAQAVSAANSTDRLANHMKKEGIGTHHKVLLNDAPTAVDDEVPTVTTTLPITIAVLANDSDINGDVLTVTQVSTPVSGTATISGTTHIIYTPDVNAEGTTTFTYTVSDGALTSSALVTVTINACPLFGLMYVDGIATGLNNGSSWDNAYTELYLALAQAGRCAGPNDVWVAAGVYKPESASNYFGVEDGLGLYGGFAGHEIFWNQRDWTTNVTVLSGDVDNNDNNITAKGILSNTADINGDNSDHVISATNASNVIIDGFYITAGQANGGSSADSGGGLYVSNSTVTLSNTMFIGNYAFDWGGGIEITNKSNVIILNSRFINNYAYLGGGADLDHGQVVVMATEFTGNYAEAAGGGIFVTQFMTSTFNEVLFDGNRAGEDGGGALLAIAASELTDVTFTSNEAQTNDGGGLMISQAGWVTITNGRFAGNSANDDGGAIALDEFGNLTLINSLVSGNSANENGGGIENVGWLTLTNSTIAGNQATIRGGGVRHLGNALFANSIIWNNMDETGIGTTSSALEDSSFSLDIDYSLIQGWNPTGSGNLNGNLATNDPDFISPEPPTATVTTAGNYQLMAGSPAIDVGDNTVCPPADLHGIIRPQGNTCDFGASEYVTLALTATLITTDTALFKWNDITDSSYNILRSSAPYNTFTIWVTGLFTTVYSSSEGFKNPNINYFYQVHEPQSNAMSETVGAFTFPLKPGS